MPCKSHLTLPVLDLEPSSNKNLSILHFSAYRIAPFRRFGLADSKSLNPKPKPIFIIILPHHQDRQNCYRQSLLTYLHLHS